MSDPIKPFIPALGLKHPKAQMLWPFVLNPLIRTHSTERHETFTLSDDDVIDLTWYGPQHGPIVLMLHGITGHANSPYCKALTYFLAEKGWRACVIHARGCGPTPNRLHKSHHGADTLGLTCVVQHLHNQSPTTPLMAVGFSLGGSVLLNYLATQHTLTAAVGICIPHQLGTVAAALDHPNVRLYQKSILKGLQTWLRRKYQQQHLIRPHYPDCIQNSIQAFDEWITAPCNHFQSATEYYQTASCGQKLKHIQTPTLIIQSQDDPLIRTPIQPTQLSNSTQLMHTESGGHIGFVSRYRPQYCQSWLHDTAWSFLQPYA